MITDIIYMLCLGTETCGYECVRERERERERVKARKEGRNYVCIGYRKIY